jgi:hypothetical protein
VAELGVALGDEVQLTPRPASAPGEWWRRTAEFRAAA